MDPAVLDGPDEEPLLILREEVEAAVKALKTGKSAGVDIISGRHGMYFVVFRH